jgi:hypothetical protein
MNTQTQKVLVLYDVETYVSENISTFHAARLDSLAKLKLKNILLKKNPYLFKAKNILTAQDLVKTILDAYVSSQEETMFGNFLEGLAIFICEKMYNGKKSSTEGIDLEFENDNTRYIVTIKSGPNWGNSSQINRMLDNFRKAKKTLSTSGSKINVMAVNGCCYGRCKVQQEEYQKMCGQRFWEFISGSKDLYTDLIEPLGHQAKEKNDEFAKAYAEIINRFTLEFGNEYCEDGRIKWLELVKLNSSAQIQEKTTEEVKTEGEVVE